MVAHCKIDGPARSERFVSFVMARGLLCSKPLQPYFLSVFFSHIGEEFISWANYRIVDFQRTFWAHLLLLLE
jgi:hypothetical protein